MRLVKTASAAMIASLAALAILGVFSARAEETALHFYSCQKRENGIYEDPNCRRITGTFVYERLGLSSAAEKVKSVGKSEFELDVTLLGIPTHIGCTSEAGTGTAWNPEPFKTQSGQGKTTMTFEGCTVSKPATCALPGKKFVTKELKAALEESKTLGQGVKLTPVSGETFAELSLGAECPVGEKVLIKGSDFGIANEKGLVEFTEASSSLLVGANKVKLKGTTKEEDEKGNAIVIAP